jgi:hypothetical protein
MAGRRNFRIKGRMMKVPSFGMWHRVVRYNFTDVSEERSASIAFVGLLLDAEGEGISSSETSAKFCRSALRYIPEYGKFHSQLCDNLKYVAKRRSSS